MNFIKIPSTTFIILLLLFAFACVVDVYQLRVNELTVHTAEKDMRRLTERPYDNSAVQATLVSNAKLTIKGAKREQRIETMMAWYHVLILAAGVVILGYKWIKR